MKASLCPDGHGVKAFTATALFTPPNAMEELSPKKAYSSYSGKGDFCFSLVFFAIHGETAFAAIR